MDNQYNNGFGFNNQNDYDNNQYNQYNQYNQGYNQQMMQQQMYNQYPNQYPNQYDPNGGMYVQPTVHKSNRGGGFFSFLLALLLVAGLVVFLLDYTGKVDVKALYHKIVNKEDKKEEKSDKEEEKEKEEEKTTTSEEEELDKMCSELDEEGYYNKEFVDSLNQKIEELPDSAGVNELWELVKGSKYCSKQECHIYGETDDHIIHDYVCITKKYNKTTMEDKIDEAYATTYIDAACRALDENGNPVESPSSPIGQVEGLTCSEFVCKVTINEKEYSRNCKEE